MQICEQNRLSQCKTTIFTIFALFLAVTCDRKAGFKKYIFAPFDSAHRTEQSDIGFGVSGWLLKFDPTGFGIGPGLENFGWKPGIMILRLNIVS